jgi:hypothetical protein
MRRLFLILAWSAAFGLAGCAVLARLLIVDARPPSPGAAAAQPPQPAGLAVFHRSGQTFITWSERADLAGEWYRVYRHTSPISAGNLAAATLVYTLSEGSGQFYADRYNHQAGGDWRPRYADRYVLHDLGGQIPAGTGLLVWTVSNADGSGSPGGEAYYAVTTLSGTIENRLDFSAANAMTAPVSEQAADPLPVEVTRTVDGLGHVFVQYMDLRAWNPAFHAPREGNQFYGLDPNDPAVARSAQYAYTYAVGEPEPANCGGVVPTGTLPLIVWLHGWGGDSYPPDLGPTAYYCAMEIRPVDVSETWFFGFAEKHDYRQGGEPGAGDTVANYTEQRVMRMVYDLLRHPTLGPRIDRNRIYAWGQSMGGSGALALAMRYPQVFAAVYSSQGMTNYRASGDGGGVDWRSDVTPKWGAVALNLPVRSRGPGAWADPLKRYDGTGVWDWQNHQANLVGRLADEMAPLGVTHGFNDMVIEWPTQGRPAYAAFDAGRRAWGGYVSSSGHTWIGFEGLPPTLAAAPDLSPFAGFRVVLDESVPGLSGGSADAPLPPPTTTEPSLYNMALDWSASWNPWDGPPVDTAAEWRISLRTTDGATHTVDVTPRRLQVFQVVSHTTYAWENRRVVDGGLVASGTAVADGAGIVTVPDVRASPLGNRLSLRAGQPVTLTPRVWLPMVFRLWEPAPAPTGRAFPDTSSRIAVFNDQLDLRGVTQAQLQFAASHYAGSQKLTLGDARRLRALNPGFIVLHYRLGQALGHSVPDAACQPTTDYLAIINGDDWVQEWPGDGVVQEEWFARQDGARIYNCEYGHYLMNLDDPGWRDWWSGQVISQLAANEDDGLFADSYNIPNYGFRWNPSLPVIDPAFESAWADRQRAFTDYILARFAGRWKWIPNVGSYVTTRDPSDYSNADGLMIEGFAEWGWGDFFDPGDWVLQMDRLLPLIRAGRIILAQTYPNPADVEERLFVLGSYLLIKGSRTYINLDTGLELEWFPEYSADLGAAVDSLPSTIDGLFDAGWQVYARRYQRGLVLVNPSATARSVTLPAPMARLAPSGGGEVPASGQAPGSLAYVAAASVTLEPHRAAILFDAPPR